MYRSLVQLKRYQGPLEDLCLDFTGAVSRYRRGGSAERLMPAEQCLLSRQEHVGSMRVGVASTFPLPVRSAVESDFLGTTVSEELVPGGSRLAVTSANVLQVGQGGAGRALAALAPSTRLPLLLGGWWGPA